MKGLLTAVMLAALMSDLESIFNSAGTLFTIDIWKKFRPAASQTELVFVGKIIGNLLIRNSCRTFCLSCRSDRLGSCLDTYHWINKLWPAFSVWSRSCELSGATYCCDFCPFCDVARLLWNWGILGTCSWNYHWDRTPIIYVLGRFFSLFFGLWWTLDLTRNDQI